MMFEMLREQADIFNPVELEKALPLLVSAKGPEIPSFAFKPQLYGFYGSDCFFAVSIVIGERVVFG